MATVSQLNPPINVLNDFSVDSHPSLLSVRQMQLAIAKERMRCDRFGHHFCAILISLRCKRSAYRWQLDTLAEVLRGRLRLTDEFGLLDERRVAVILPMSNRASGETVLLSIVRLAAERAVAFDAEVFTYPADLPETYGDTEAAEGAVEGGSAAGDSGTIDEDYSSSYPGPAATIAVARTERVTAPHRLRAPSPESLGRLAMRYPRWKRAFDLVAAGCGLVVFAPVIAIAAAAIRLSSSGPAFYFQERTGQYGRMFRIIKLRTMIANADSLKPMLLDRNERDGPAFKMADDPRVTRVGRLLRRTGIDELPQLINVLRGEMAIVGPRPLPCDEQAECELWQYRRLDTKPGLTCYWQISKGRKVSFTEWMRMDLRYHARRSPWCDAGLIVRTCASVVLGRVGH